MLIEAKDMNGYRLAARDGEIGKVKEFYFDDRNWTIRYLVADTGAWLSSRRVLISPYALEAVNPDAKVLPVDLTKKQIENSPPLEADKPVSRQYEIQYYPYYDYPAYWGGPYMWGPTPYPSPKQHKWSDVSGAAEDNDPHLRSTHDVSGRNVEASDGEIGHVEDFVVDDESWSIRYLILSTRNWWPGKKVLISPQWIERISWEESKVFVNLTREAIQQAPEYIDKSVLTREYETALHRHHKRDAYWIVEVINVPRG